MPREHGEAGEFVETVTLEDALETFEYVRGAVILSGDVADRLGCSRETARRKLEELYERGDVDRRKAARRVIYWRAEEAPPAAPGDEPAASTDADAEAETPTTESAELTSGVTDRTAPPATDDLLARWDPGRDREEREDRRVIGRQVLEWFRETEGYVSAADVKAVHYPELTYGDESADTWWRKLGRPPLKAAVDAGLAEYREGYHDYWWLGEAGDRDGDIDEEDGDLSNSDVYDPTEEL